LSNSTMNPVFFPAILEAPSVVTSLYFCHRFTHSKTYLALLLLCHANF
jgi:hypothetical protein